MTTKPERRVKRLYIPIILGLLVPFLFNLHLLWEEMNLPSSAIFTLGQVGIIGGIVCLVGILVWFFVFSGVTRRTRLIGLGVLILMVAGAVAAIDEVFFTGELRVGFRYRWQTRPRDTLKEYLAEETGAGGLPKIDLSIDPINDFPRYRGINADGVVNPVELLDMKWSPERLPKEIWRHPCGRGFAGFAVAGNVLVTIEQRGKEETIVCYDRASGKQHWAVGYPAEFKHPTGGGPRATPTIADDGMIYSLGSLGDLVCVEGKKGEIKWKVNILEDNQAKRMEWGMTSSPLVVDNLVVVEAGIDPNNNVERSLVAYDRTKGERVWGSGKYGAGYSSPQLVNLAGRKQILMFDAGGLAGFDIKTGKELWRYVWDTFQSMNIIQPVLVGQDRVFISSETTNGGALLKIVRKDEDFGVEVVWTSHALCSQYANPVKLGNALYGLSSGRMVCVSLDSSTNPGERLWRANTTYGRGQVMAVSGSLLVQSERGVLALVAADPKEFRESARIEVFNAPRTWNTFAVAGRYIYMRNEFEMVCYQIPLRE